MLERRIGADPGDRIGELAHHWAAATVPAAATKAVDYARRAGDRALIQLAPDEALRWYNQALDLHDAHLDPTTHVALMIGLGTAQRQTGAAEYRETLLEAAAQAIEIEDTELLVDAALANHRGIVSSILHIDDERVAVLRAALDAVGHADTTHRARLLAVLATELSLALDPAPRRAFADEAIEIARRLGDDPTLLAALSAWVSQHITYATDDAASLRAVTDELLELAERLGDQASLAGAATSTATIALNFGDRDWYDRTVDIAISAANRVGQPTLRWRAIALATMRAIIDGHLADGEQLTEEVLTFGSEVGEPDAFAWYGSLIATIRTHQGRAQELSDVVEELIRTSELDSAGNRGARIGLLLGAFETGETEAIRRGLDDLAACDFEYGTFTNLALCAAAHACVKLGDSTFADALLDRLEPIRGMIDCAVTTNAYATSTCAAMLLALQGRDADADERFAEGYELAHRFRTPYHEAFAQVEWARAILTREHVDAHRAAELLNNARAAARDHGYGQIERDAVALLR